MKKFDVIIVGAGAAGLMCALRAGQRGRRVLLLDHNDQAGAKILISGGGRCNFTNINATPDRYLSDNPSFAISALKTYRAADFIALVEKHKIAYHEKTLGQLFCDSSARAIVDMLLAECAAGHVDLRLNQNITAVTKADEFCVQTQTDLFHADALVLASGGLSIPKLGATNFAHRIAQQFYIPLTAIRPGLVPLTFDGTAGAMMKELAGVSLDSVARFGKKSFREGMVFTHRGLSGPAILQISSLWREGQGITLDLAPDVSVETLLLDRKKTRAKSELKTILGECLPQRLAQAITTTLFRNPVIGTMSEKGLKDIAALIKAWSLMPSGSEGYAKAEVTLGGIDTTALSSKTMQVNAVSGLYVIGEAVDVTGWLGGYNFQWGWSSGWAAGTAV